MRHILIIASFVLFAVAYISEYRVNELFHGDAHWVEERYRSTYAVREGTSPDGSLTIAHNDDAPLAETRFTVPNFARNLRLYILPDRGKGTPTLFLESAKPRHIYKVSGAFSVIPEETGFQWTTPSGFVMNARSASGTPVFLDIDVRALSMNTLSQPPDVPLVIPGTVRIADASI